MSLLTIVANACDRLSLTRPSAVVTSTDQLIRQLYGLANAEGAALAKRGDWQALVAEWTFITVAQAAQTNTPIPGDLRKFIPGSFFNRTTVRQLVGPVTPQQWQLYQARPAAAYVYLAFRERQGDFLITPVPPAGETIAYEYVSTNWAMSSAGQGKTSFTSDDDTAALDEELLTLGLQWRFKQAKGLDYGEDMATYERAVASALGEDGASSTLNIGGPVPVLPPDRANLPEGGFGL
jgi:hypothetical protein